MITNQTLLKSNTFIIPTLYDISSNKKYTEICDTKAEGSIYILSNEHQVKYVQVDEDGKERVISIEPIVEYSWSNVCVSRISNDMIYVDENSSSQPRSIIIIANALNPDTKEVVASGEIIIRQSGLTQGKESQKKTVSTDNVEVVKYVNLSNLKTLWKMALKLFSHNDYVLSLERRIEHLEDIISKNE